MIPIEPSPFHEFIDRKLAINISKKEKPDFLKLFLRDLQLRALDELMNQYYITINIVTHDHFRIIFGDHKPYLLISQIFLDTLKTFTTDEELDDCAHLIASVIEKTDFKSQFEHLNNLYKLFDKTKYDTPDYQGCRIALWLYSRYDDRHEIFNLLIHEKIQTFQFILNLFRDPIFMESTRNEFYTALFRYLPTFAVSIDGEGFNMDFLNH